MDGVLVELVEYLRAQWDWLVGINGTASLRKGQALGAGLGALGHSRHSHGAANDSLHSLHSRQMAGQGLQRGPSHVSDLVVGGRSRGGPDGTDFQQVDGGMLQKVAECCIWALHHSFFHVLNYFA